MNAFSKLIAAGQAGKASLDIAGQSGAIAARVLQELATRELLSDPRYDNSGCLMRSRRQIFSQFGQDGIITEIFRRIGTRDRKFVEIGVAPLESNSTYLLLQGWSGYWVDPTLPQDSDLPPDIDVLQREGQLQLQRAFLRKESALQLLRSIGVPDGLDLLVIDIDYNTYHIWRELCALNPRVICVEYNSHFPPDIEWVAPYKESGIWDMTINYGASLKAFAETGKNCGYALVGCELSGTDAFFVRSDLVGDRFFAATSAEVHYEPPRFYLQQTPGHQKGFTPSSEQIHGVTLPTS